MKLKLLSTFIPIVVFASLIIFDVFIAKSEDADTKGANQEESYSNKIT